MILAIEDEIYDEGCEGYGFDAAITHNEKSYELPSILNPQSRKQTNLTSTKAASSIGFSPSARLSANILLISTVSPLCMATPNGIFRPRAPLGAPCLWMTIRCAS